MTMLWKNKVIRENIFKTFFECFTTTGCTGSCILLINFNGATYIFQVFLNNTILSNLCEYFPISISNTFRVEN